MQDLTFKFIICDLEEVSASAGLSALTFRVLICWDQPILEESIRSPGR